MTKQTEPFDSQEGQAGALLGPLAEDAGGLRFDSHDEALNHVRALSKESNRWWTLNTISPPP